MVMVQGEWDGATLIIPQLWISCAAPSVDPADGEESHLAGYWSVVKVMSFRFFVFTSRDNLLKL